MEDDRISRAFARIEAAARRVETAAAGLPAQNPDAELLSRHDRLKQEAAAVLAEMDSLIGSLER